MRFFGKPFRWAIIYSFLLIAFTTYILLDTFVIVRKYNLVSEDPVSQSTSERSEYELTASTYTDDNISIKLTTYIYKETKIFAADITLSDVSNIKTALAENTYGKNIKAHTSEIAKDNDAILAINGDYYGSRNEGYVIRNGVLYRSVMGDYNQQDLVIFSDGSMNIINESDISADKLLENGAQQVLSFGPGLINDGEITVSVNDEVDKAKVSNPRTAVGYYSPLHYVFLTSDGRTEESAGLSLYELAQFMKEELGTQMAYNLDGGGSSTMVFAGDVLNNPTSDGKSIQERSVSDIVYIGY